MNRPEKHAPLERFLLRFAISHPGAVYDPIQPADQRATPAGFAIARQAYWVE